MFEDLFATSGLSLERLHTLLKLNDAESLIQAANGDMGKQSRLSHQLTELSEHFGIELTERSGKSIKLTAAGKTLANVVREHFLALQAFRNDAAKVVPAFQIAAGDSLAQWLLVPAIGKMIRPINPFRFKLINLRTKGIVEHLKERKVEFGVLRADAVGDLLHHEEICEQRYAIFVPQRLVPTRGMLTIKNALLSCPHAAIGGDGQLVERLRELGRRFGGTFSPELTCDSIGQCVAAVETGAFAAVLPVHAWTASSGKDYIVVEDESLEALSRKIVLAWHPRTLEVLGSTGRKVQQSLANALKQQGATDE